MRAIDVAHSANEIADRAVASKLSSDGRNVLTLGAFDNVIAIILIHN